MNHNLEKANILLNLHIFHLVTITVLYQHLNPNMGNKIFQSIISNNLIDCYKNLYSLSSRKNI